MNGSETTQKWNEREDLGREGKGIYEPLRVSHGDEKYMQLNRLRWREAADTQRHGVQYDGLELSKRYTIQVGYNTSHNKKNKKIKFNQQDEQTDKQHLKPVSSAPSYQTP